MGSVRFVRLWGIFITTRVLFVRFVVSVCVCVLGCGVRIMGIETGRLGKSIFFGDVWSSVFYGFIGK